MAEGGLQGPRLLSALQQSGEGVAGSHRAGWRKSWQGKTETTAWLILFLSLSLWLVSLSLVLSITIHV